MNQVLKQLLTFAFALVFMAGTALAQSNESIINQISAGSDATVTQTGLDNFSQLDQSNDFIDGHSATIEQIGDDNYSWIKTQNGGGTAEVYMNGDQNSLVSFPDRQRGTAANQKNSLNFFDLDIDGDMNTVGMDQEFGTGTVNVVGSGNAIGLRQRAGANYQTVDFHKATIDVDGSDNVVDVNQGPDFGSGGINNVATVMLMNGSDNNLVDIRQRGSNNTSTTIVDGLNNTAEVVQQP
jgi:hypothetical protein